MSRGCSSEALRTSSPSSACAPPSMRKIGGSVLPAGHAYNANSEGNERPSITLGVSQAEVSKMERRTELYVGTLRPRQQPWGLSNELDQVEGVTSPAQTFM